ncbi:FAD-dependent oxidoreductase [Streptomyces sp. NPDC059008]|uniref:FAD-dependent oxidoreductase n=1 Tax=Streptomyces sp. NPDC059008 TaxID=3346693 RepID=UPI0036A456D3
MTTPPVLIAGAGIAGLATALALRERGYRVRILERSGPPPEGPAAKAAEGWRRPTVPQSDHSHVLTSLGMRVLAERLPGLLDALREEGGHTLDLTAAAPRTAPGRVREPADDQLVALAMRRPVLELVLHRAVRDTAGIEIDYGTTVRGLLLAPSGRTVAGVVTDRGEHLPAQVVVDASGRKAASRSWLDAAGIPLAEDLTSPTAVRVVTRFYRLTGPGRPGPLNRGNAAGGIYGHYAAVLHPADGDVFAVSLGLPTGDPATRGLPSPQAFTAVARLSPYLGPWFADGVAVPLTPVRALTFAPNILRGTATARQQPVAGLFPVADAACVTDPLYGRGLSLAFAHAFALADLLDSDPAVGTAQSERAAHLAEELFGPWYAQAAQDGLARIGLWRAAAEGAPPPRQGTTDTTARPSMASIATAAACDPTVWRGLTRMLMTLSTPAEVFDDADFRARVHRARPLAGPAGPLPPTREELLDAMATGPGAQR